MKRNDLIYFLTVTAEILMTVGTIILVNNSFKNKEIFNGCLQLISAGIWAYLYFNTLKNKK